MNRKQSSTATASSRHLRDSLTILSSNFPHDERIHHNSNHVIKPRQQQLLDEPQPLQEDGIRLHQEQQQQKEEETQQEQAPRSQREEILLLQKKNLLRELIPVLVSGPLVGSGGGIKRRHADHDEQGWMEVKKRPYIVVKENENGRQDTEGAGGTGGENQDHHEEEEEEDGGKDMSADKDKQSHQYKKMDVNNHLQQQWYKDKLQALKSDNERILQKRKDIFQGYARLISSYDYGLKYISNLKDLAQAPDNFMEGNFVDASKGKM